MERCKNDAFKYKTRTEWQNKSKSVYTTAIKNGWLNECCSHMTELKKPRGYWTLERCKLDALKYKTRTEWYNMSRTGFDAACKKGWVDDCCTHMSVIKRKNNYWTLELCKRDALKYNSKKEWDTNSAGYVAAYKKGWLNDCCAHMRNKLTLESCKIDALKYNNVSSWRKNSCGVYSTASKNGWLKKCTKHMSRKQISY